MKLSNARTVRHEIEALGARLDNLAGMLSDYLEHEASRNADILAVLRQTEMHSLATRMTCERIERTLTQPSVNGAEPEPVTRDAE